MNVTNSYYFPSCENLRRLNLRLHSDIYIFHPLSLKCLLKAKLSLRKLWGVGTAVPGVVNGSITGSVLVLG